MWYTPQCFALYNHQGLPSTEGRCFYPVMAFAQATQPKASHTDQFGRWQHFGTELLPTLADPSVEWRLKLPLENMWGFTFMSGSDSGTTGRGWHAAAGDLFCSWALQRGLRGHRLPGLRPERSAWRSTHLAAGQSQIRPARWRRRPLASKYRHSTIKRVDQPVHEDSLFCCIFVAIDEGMY